MTAPNRGQGRISFRRVDTLVAAVAAAFAPSVAFASDFEFTIHGFYIIDFLVFVGILVYVGRKPIAAMLDSRYKTVVAEIDEARALREAAQARFDEYKARLDHLETELASALTEVRKGTRIEVERILADARVSADRIAAEESARLSQESKRLREELAATASSAALRLAEAELQATMDAAIQARLVERTLNELESGGPIATAGTGVQA